ncbi:MAG: sulfotransferase [Chloroflexota bacterium]|nr:sulfotransferase [Chloroflexota bacterium]
MSFIRRLFKRETQEVAVVSGLPRSGTSMMMKMLEAGGIQPLTDEIREADADNPKGYYEFERVKQLDKGDQAWLSEAEGKAVKVISALLKHLPDTHQYKVIFMRREMSEILASQQRMLSRRGEAGSGVDDEQMAAMFEKHLKQTTAWLETQPNVDVLYVNYNDVLAEPARQVQRLNHFFGGMLNTERMAGVVDERLYRQRVGDHRQ